MTCGLIERTRDTPGGNRHIKNTGGNDCIEVMIVLEKALKWEEEEKIANSGRQND